MPASERKSRRWLLGAAIIGVVAALVYAGQQLRQPTALTGFAAGNGRLEATAYDIASKRPGRVVEVLVREGNSVESGQVLARIDTTELEAARAEAEAGVRRAREGEHLASALVAQRGSDLKLALTELARTESLVERRVVSEQRLDQSRAQAESAEAGHRAAREQVHEARAAIASAEATLARVQIEIDESAIASPIRGRVLYRLVEPGEVVGAGGKLLTVLDLSDVFMTLFLPTGEAGRLRIGAEARLVLDAAPEFVFPASVSFVAPEAQFTPKEVETRSEREKLMFRVKVKLDPALLARYEPYVKSGLPGEASVRIDDAAPWPARLAVRLPE